MKSPLASLLIILCGLSSTALVFALVLGVEYALADHQLFRLHTLTVFFVLPLSTLLIGSLACYGFYLGARLTQHRPGHFLLTVMLGFALLMYPAMTWFEYRFILSPMDLLPQGVTYVEFLYRDAFASQVELFTRSGRGGRSLDFSLLSLWTTIVLVAGYLVGALAIYVWIRSLAWCRDCGRFMKTRGRQTRYPADQNEVSLLASEAQVLSETGDDAEIHRWVARHAALPAGRDLKRSRWRTILFHRECAVCGSDCVEFQSDRFGQKGWDRQQDNILIYLSDEFEGLARG